MMAMTKIEYKFCRVTHCSSRVGGRAARRSTPVFLINLEGHLVKIDR